MQQRSPAGSVRTAVFDLDGTLADTSADLIAAANATFAEAGRGAPLDVAGDALIAFAGGRAMLRAGFARLGVEPGKPGAEPEVDRLYPRLLELYGAALCEETRLYDGAAAALDRLALAGWRLAVCTNKPALLADRLLRRLAVLDRFAVMLGADSLVVRKPDPQHLIETILRAGGTPARALMIGDTATDRTTARAAGVPCILVGFGPEGAGVAALDPEAVLAHFDDLPTLAERLVPAAAPGAGP